MKIVDLKILLEQFDNDMEIMLDQTKQGSDMFHFLSLEHCQEVTYDVGEGEKTCVLLSHLFYESDNEDSNIDKSRLN